MVHYTELNESHKRGILTYYLFICLIGFIMTVTPTGIISPISNTNLETRYEHNFAYPMMGMDSSVCGGACHGEQYNYWIQTNHADDLEFNGTHILNLGHIDAVNISYFNTTCAPCHATGYDEIDKTWTELGVGCLDCHELTSPYLSYSGDICGSCHNPEIHADVNQYHDWAYSSHPNSLTDLRASGHAASYCMHCEATEAFIFQQNPDSLASFVDITFDPFDDYNSISCQACHSVHSNWSITSSNMLRAASPSELCGLCHIGSSHPTYQVWEDSTHESVGVECTDCHGYDTIQIDDNLVSFLNHTFLVTPEVACGQSSQCHQDTLPQTLDEMYSIQSDFGFFSYWTMHEAGELRLTVMIYNETAGSDATLVNYMISELDEIEETVQYYINDGSSGIHDPIETINALNSTYIALHELADYFAEHESYFTPTSYITTTSDTTTSLQTESTTPHQTESTSETEPTSSPNTQPIYTLTPIAMIITLGSIIVIVVFSCLIVKSRK